MVNFFLHGDLHPLDIRRLVVVALLIRGGLLFSVDFVQSQEFFHFLLLLLLISLSLFQESVEQLLFFNFNFKHGVIQLLDSGDVFGEEGELEEIVDVDLDVGLYFLNIESFRLRIHL